MFKKKTEGLGKNIRLKEGMGNREKDHLHHHWIKLADVCAV